MASLLSSRGIHPENVPAFLDPSSGGMHPFNLLPDIEKASERLSKAIKQKEKILVYADYDVDGVVGGLIVYEGLKNIGANCKLFLPERKAHGYGLNLEVLKRAVDDGVNIVLSVDCGISNRIEADYLANAGIDFIISDHHQPPEQLPRAYALVDPKLPNSEYPYRELAGAMVGAKLVAGVYEACGRDGEEFLRKNLSLLALATVVDVCPIDGENRYIVSRGLATFAEDAPPGLLELARCAGQDPGEMSVFTFGFILGPRLNAAGRIDSPKLAAALISAKEQSKISELAHTLDSLNKKRKQLASRGFKQAASRVEAGECHGPIITLHSPEWHEGVIGLIAANLTDAFRRPALVATNTADGMLKGSGRTSGVFNLFDALKAAERKLSGYGGHSAAVGFKLHADDFSEFVKDLASENDIRVDDENFIPVLNLDGELNIGDIGEAEVKELALTGPWGRGNEAPTFLFKGVGITRCDTMGDGTHVRLRLQDNSASINAVGFGLNRDGALTSRITEKADIAAIPEINDFRGNRDVRLRLKDIRFI